MSKITPETGPSQREPIGQHYFSRRELGRIRNGRIERNDLLGFTYYNIHRTRVEDPYIEIYISDEARALGLDFKQMLGAGLQEIQSVRRNPFGVRSLDPYDERAFRSVNHIDPKTQTLLNEAIAIKGKGNDPTKFQEDLVRQYEYMRLYERLAQRNLSAEQLSIIRFAKMYGVVRINNDEFLFMEHVVDGKQMGDKFNGFPVRLYPELLRAFPELRDNIVRNTVEWDYLADAIKNALGFSSDYDGLYEGPADITDENILWRDRRGQKEYIIIDQGGR
jgi:hypothetical protein